MENSNQVLNDHDVPSTTYRDHSDNCRFEGEESSADIFGGPNAVRSWRVLDRLGGLVSGAGGTGDRSLSEPPMVSIIIPCRDEVTFIGVCLDSIIASDYPKDRLEVLVVDGLSEDGTRGIVQDYVTRQPFIRLMDNPKKITPAAFNVGVRNAKGRIIMVMSAHTVYPANYISGLVSWLTNSNADNVGGVLATLPGNDTPTANAIAIALSHPFGVGNAYFRIGTSTPRWVDTVPFGCYKREVFDRIGIFDEELVRNQDDEFNLRLIQRGGRILLVPHIISSYYARDSLRKLWRMYYQYGYFKPLVAKKVGSVLTFRQLVPALFVLSLLATGMFAPWSVYSAKLLGAVTLAYFSASGGCSIFAAFRKGLRSALALPVVFPVLHLSYGVGFITGVLHHLVFGRELKKDAVRIPMSR